MTWKKVCDVGDVDVDTVKLFDVEGVNVLIVNYGEGYKAIPPLCPHMEEPLAESGIVVRCKLTCSKHLWAWDLRSGDLLGPAEKPLKYYETREEDGALFVNMVEELVYEFESEDDFDDDFFGQS
jgi:toluene monooxygenase system ferredoxin subunit